MLLHYVIPVTSSRRNDDNNDSRNKSKFLLNYFVEYSASNPFPYDTSPLKMTYAAISIIYRIICCNRVFQY